MHSNMDYTELTPYYFAEIASFSPALIVTGSEKLTVTPFSVSTPDPQVSLTVLMAAMERGISTTGSAGTDWRALVPALAVFWLAGTLVQQTRLLYQWWGTQRLKRSFHLPMPVEWQDYIDTL